MNREERTSLLRPSAAVEQVVDEPALDVDFSAQTAKEVSHYETDQAGSIGNWKDSCVLPFVFSVFIISIPLLWFFLVFQNVYLNPFNYSPEFESIGPQQGNTSFFNAANITISRPISHLFIERNINDHFPKLLKQYGVAGAQLVLIDKEQENDDKTDNWRVRGYTFGLRDIYFQVNNTVDNFTLFQVGQLSETATAFSVMLLVQNKMINSLDDSVNTYLKRWVLRDENGKIFNQTSIRDLLEHSSGIVNNDRYETFYGYNTAAISNPPSVLQTLTSTSVDSKKAGSVNLDRRSVGAEYSVLQLLIEDVTKKNFTDWINLNVLNPMGLLLSTFNTNDVSDDRVFSSTYGSYFYQVPDYGYTIQSAFGLYSCAKEYTNLVISGLNAGNVGNVILNSENTEALFSGGKWLNHLPYYTVVTPGSLIETLSDNSKTMFRVGSNIGWKAQFAFNKEHRQGFILFTNTETAEPIMDVFRCHWEYQMTGDDKNNACDRVADRGLGNLITIIVTWVFAVALFIFWAIMTIFVCHSKVPLTCNFPFLAGDWLETANSLSIIIRLLVVVITGGIYIALMVFLHSDIFGLAGYNVSFIIFAVKYAPYYLPFSSLVFGFFCMTIICIACFVYKVLGTEKKDVKNYERVNY